MPDAAWLQGVLRKAVAAVTGFMLALVLLAALLLTGFYMLVNAATLALSPQLGEAGALAVMGLVCLSLVALFFYRMTRPVAPKKSVPPASASSATPPLEAIRNMVRRNPLEAAAAAFALGLVEQSDPRLKSLLLEGGMMLMEEAKTGQARTREETAPAASNPGPPVT